MKARRGFVLAAALAAIVLIAVLVTAALFATSQESHATAAEILDEQAAAYAERAALLTVAGWSCPECDLLPRGAVIIRAPASHPPLESTVFITRLDSALFLVNGEGRVMSGGVARIRRRVSLLVRTARDSLGVQRALRADKHSWSAAYQM